MQELDNFLSGLINDTLYGRRVRMWGGRSQEGKVFEFWQQLLMEKEGTSAEITEQGWKMFSEHGKCNKLGDLARHLDG